MADIKHISKRLVVSYVFDWIVIIVIAAVGGSLSYVTGYRRPFYLEDPAIAFPLLKDTVSYGVVIAIALAAPAAIIVLVSLVLVPGPTVSRHTPTSNIWRRKIWEWNTGWMGLGLSLALSLFVTEGLKDMTGKPRPDLLARCQPDTAHFQNYIVGGLGGILGEGINMVDSRICQNPDSEVLRDGFASFPSGHSSFSTAGLIYLSLWLCSKFAIAIPFLSPRSHEEMTNTDANIVPLRNRAAAPPVWLIVVAGFPIATALYVCTSRYADYHHAGFDVIVGAIIGTFFAWFGFRWYHLPVRRGAGWAWGPRSRDRAFYIGIGLPSYVGGEGWDNAKVVADPPVEDLESGDRSGRHILAERRSQPAPMETEMETYGQNRRNKPGSDEVASC